MKKETITKCELAMLGKVQQLDLQGSVNAMTQYIARACGHELPKDFNIWDRIDKYTEKSVEYITTYRIGGMPCICYLLSSMEEEPDFPEPFEEDYGTGYPCAFCYVLNLSADDTCSEFGDVFFSKQADGFYHVAS